MDPFDPSKPKPVAAPKPAGVGLFGMLANSAAKYRPGVSAKPAPVAPAAPAAPSAAQLNAQYDAGGYGPKSTPAQFAQAKGQDAAARHYSSAPIAPRPQAPAPVPTVGVRAPVNATAAPQQARPGVAAQPVAPADMARKALQDQLAAAQDQWRNRQQTGDVAQLDAVNSRLGDSVTRSAMALNQYDNVTARTQQGDKVGMIERIMALPPESRRVGLMAAGVDPDQVGVAAQVAPGEINSTNYLEVAGRDPRMAGAVGVLGGAAPIHEQASHFAGIDGIGDPDNPYRRLWDSHMAARQAADGPGFDHELGMYAPGDPTGARVNDLSSPVSALGSIFAAAKDGIFGPDQGVVDRNLKFNQDMAKLGYAPAIQGRQGQGGESDLMNRLLSGRRADY